MEDEQTILTEKLEVFQVQHGMENTEIILMKKLDILSILKESIKIPYKCPKFIFLTFLTSLPLIITMMLHEIIVQAIMFETKSILITSSPHYSDYLDYIFALYNLELDSILMLFQNVYPKVIQLTFLYLVPSLLLDLYSTIITINSASDIYGERRITLREMVLAPFWKEGGFTGPLVTSLYVLSLNCFVLFGLLWTVMHSLIHLRGFFVVIYLVITVVLIVKWIEWSAVWNMSIVISVLEGRHKFAALWSSEYFSRGSRKRGLQLMLIYFAWRIIMRLSCYYMAGQEIWAGIAVTSFLSCVGNVMKWVVCTVYFYDCKKRTMEKKVDAEIEEVLNGNISSTLCNDV